MSAEATTDTVQTAFSFSFETIEGQPLPLSQFEGRVLLVVNTASRCGFTPQYDGLQALWEEYRHKGLVVIGVPTGDFGGQELATNRAIKEFCSVNFAIDFPMTEKTAIKGGDAHPFYQWAGDKVGMMGRPRWNFHKYLIGRDGNIADWFSSATAGDAKKLRTAIVKALALPADTNVAS